MAKPKNQRLAERGEYGTPVPTREGLLADVLLESIQLELGDADYFTREDLLHLSAFNYIATVTRYSYTCAAVTVLLERGKLIAKSKTELVLVGKSRRWRDLNTQINEYGSTIYKLVRGLIRRDKKATVMAVVDLWQNDQHLTRNVKRVIARNAMREMVTARIITKEALGRFVAGAKYNDRTTDAGDSNAAQSSQ